MYDLSMLPNGHFQLLLEDIQDDEGLPDPFAQLRNELLHMTLAPGAYNQTSELSLARMSPTVLQMQTRKMTPTGAERTEAQIDLNIVDISPDWGSPSAPEPSWKISVTANIHEPQESLVFIECRDMYKLQQAITGFKVVFDGQCRDKALDFFHSEGSLRPAMVKQVVSKVQLWHSAKIDDNGIAPNPGSTTALFPHLRSPQRMFYRTFSDTIPLISSLCVISSSDSIMTDTAPTSISNVYSRHATRLPQRASPIMRRSGNEFTNFEPPFEPILVLFVHNNNRDFQIRSLLGIRIDAKTTLGPRDWSSCRLKGPCMHALIRRKDLDSDTLEVYRVPLEADAWNLAVLCNHICGRRTAIGGKLCWVRITFATTEECTEFKQELNRLKAISSAAAKRFAKTSQRKSGLDENVDVVRSVRRNDERVATQSSGQDAENVAQSLHVSC